MDINTFLSASSAVPQGAAAIIFLYDYFRKKAPGKRTNTSNSRALLLAGLLLIGVVCTTWFASWNYSHPRVIEKTAIVENAVPCPTSNPSKTGDASVVNGSGNQVNTGNGNNFTASSTPVSPKK